MNDFLRSGIRFRSPILTALSPETDFFNTRYRGLKKNANRVFAVCALVNLFLVRRKLLQPSVV